jgi:hypothetical protein
LYAHLDSPLTGGGVERVILYKEGKNEKGKRIKLLKAEKGRKHRLLPL